MTLYDYIQQGGIIMYILLLFNIIGYSLMVSKFLVLFKAKKGSEDVTNTLVDAVNSQKSGESSSATVEIAKVEILSYISKLESGISVIKIIASVSPLLGLLGTVLGVLKAFQVMAATGLSNPSDFAGGISMALLTTVAGMIVAIPHFIGHSYLIDMLDRIESSIEKKVIPKVL